MIRSTTSVFWRPPARGMDLTANLYSFQQIKTVSLHFQSSIARITGNSTTTISVRFPRFSVVFNTSEIFWCIEAHCLGALISGQIYIQNSKVFWGRSRKHLLLFLKSEPER